MTSTPLPTTPSHRVGTRRTVSALWLTVVLSYLYCDVLGLYDSSLDGVTMSDGALLAASVLMTIPITMVLVSRITPRRAARVSSIVAASIMTVVQLATLAVGDGPTSSYVYFSIIEVTITSTIVWLAARHWPDET